MKKIYLVLLFLLISCTQTKQQKAEKLVQVYLDSTLNDPHSYEKLQFSKLDSVFTTYEDDPSYISANSKEDSIKNAFADWKIQNPEFDGIGDLTDAQVNYFTKMSNYFTKAMIEKGKIAISVMNAFKPQFNGWKIIHTYRAKNGFGALGLHKITLQLDSNLTKAKQLDESE